MFGSIGMPVIIFFVIALILFGPCLIVTHKDIEDLIGRWKRRF
jgi:hypothetical protein